MRCHFLPVATPACHDAPKRSAKFINILCVVSCVVWFTTLQAGADVPRQVDTQSIEALWRVADVLKENATPTEADWSALFNSAGYASLIANEIPKDKLKDLITTAFAKGAAADQQSLSKPLAAIIEHFRQADQQRAQIAATLNEFSTTMARNAPEWLKMTSNYLPPNAQTIATPNHIAIAVFALDARGYANGIVLDPLFIERYKSSIRHFIAHEFHHFYANSMRIRPSATESADDQNLQWVVWQLHSEGIADLIDKPVIYFEQGYMAETPYAEFFKKSYTNSAQIIQQLDVLLKQYAVASDKHSVATEIKNTIPMAGHPTGYFIAKTIEHQLGRDALVQTLGNPYAFFQLYNKAAEKASLPLLSPDSLTLVKGLQAEPPTQQ